MISGLRAKKVTSGEISKFYYAGDKLLAETRNGITASDHHLYPGADLFCDDDLYVSALPAAKNQTIEYLYGINGIAGFILKQNGTEEVFYYRKNLQGDVTHILDSQWNLKAEYAYDAWGNHEITIDTDGIGSLNPIRYRGYYYDVETGLYYLKTRYYDPQVGRFINQDDANVLEIMQNKINGLNFYAYCLNNPVMFIDSNGRYPVPVLATTLMYASNDFQPNTPIDTLNHFLINTLNTGFEISSNILAVITAGFKGTKLSNISGYTTVTAAIFAIGASWFNNYYNPNLSKQEKLTHSLADTAFIGVSVGVSYLSTIGTSVLIGLVFGPVGWAAYVAVGVGILVSVGLQVLWNSIGDDIKNLFNDRWSRIFG